MTYHHHQVQENEQLKV